MDANANQPIFSLSDAINNIDSMLSNDEKSNAGVTSNVIAPTQSEEEKKLEDNTTSNDRLGKFHTHYVSSLV